jgi:hypothetical protein
MDSKVMKGILETLEDMDDRGLRKDQLVKFLRAEAVKREKEDFGSLWDDLYGLLAYLNRTEGYAAPERIPFWEFSMYLEWAESHLMFGDAFKLNLKNARRALGHVREYFVFLRDGRVVPDTASIDRALVEVCGGKRLRLVEDIPFTGDESWMTVMRQGKTARFDMADFWLMALLEVEYGNDWSALRAAAPNDGKRARVDSLRSRLEESGHSGLGDFGGVELYRHEVDRGRDWFLERGDFR